MPSPCRIRPFRMADLDRVLEMEHLGFGKDAYSRNLFAELHARRGNLFLVAVEVPKAAQASGPGVLSMTCIQGVKVPHGP